MRSHNGKMPGRGGDGSSPRSQRRIHASIKANQGTKNLNSTRQPIQESRQRKLSWRDSLSLSDAGTASRLLNQVKAQPAIKLNRQTACPPLTAVQVNQGYGISSFTHRNQFAFGHGGDPASYVQTERNRFRLAGNARIVLARFALVGNWRSASGLRHWRYIFVAPLTTLSVGVVDGRGAVTQNQYDAANRRTNVSVEGGRGQGIVI